MSANQGHVSPQLGNLHAHSPNHSPRRLSMRRRTLLALLPAVAASRPARAEAAIRIGTLRFGSLAWELDVMRRHGLVDGFAIEATEFASGPASQIALQAGSVDVVLQDWLWTSRLRSEGAPWTFAPTTAGLGAVMVPAGSPIASVADLTGRCLGIASGPLDKSWLLLRLYARQKLQLELDSAVEKSFGPPPLIAAQLEAGRIDAMLTYWPFAARAEAQGMRSVLDMSDTLVALGAPKNTPMLGFVFSTQWAALNQRSLLSFLAAARRAQAILASSDAEWDVIAPLTGTHNAAELTHLRDWYRRGVIGLDDKAASEAAARLYAQLASIGGGDLVGPSPTLAPGTFWPSP